MPAVFAQGPIKFLYPENWRIAGQSFDSTPQVVELQSPGSAFWTLHVYPADSDAVELVDEFRDAMQAEYENLEAEEIEETWEDEPVVGYDLSFYCLDFLITAKVRCWRMGNSLVLIHSQAEDRDFNEASPIFLAMTTSLARESKL
jgi:hypothetical protein